MFTHNVSLANPLIPAMSDFNTSVNNGDEDFGSQNATANKLKLSGGDATLMGSLDSHNKVSALMLKSLLSEDLLIKGLTFKSQSFSEGEEGQDGAQLEVEEYRN